MTRKPKRYKFPKIQRGPDYEIGDRNPTEQDLDIIRKKIPSVVEPESQREWLTERYRNRERLFYTNPYYYVDAYPAYPGDIGRENFPKIKEWWSLGSLLKISKLLRKIADLMEKGDDYAY